jgi:hypothetical protein
MTSCSLANGYGLFRKKYSPYFQDKHSYREDGEDNIFHPEERRKKFLQNDGNCI